MQQRKTHTKQKIGRITHYAEITALSDLPYGTSHPPRDRKHYPHAISRPGKDGSVNLSKPLWFNTFANG